MDLRLESERALVGPDPHVAMHSPPAVPTRAARRPYVQRPTQAH